MPPAGPPRAVPRAVRPKLDSVEDAIDILDRAKAEGRLGADIILTDVYLKGGMTGGDLLEVVRGRFGYGKGTMPILAELWC